MHKKEFSVKINDFEGPLDLLLHLIGQKKIDLKKIKLLELINQYINFVNANKDDLDSLSDYLVLSTYLLEIKSKMLLPHSDDLQIDGDYEEQKKSELLAKLFEYSIYKNISKDFFTSKSIREKQIDKEKEIPKAFFNSHNNELAEISKIPNSDLNRIMEILLKKQEYFGAITKKVHFPIINVEKVSLDFQNYLKGHKINNQDLFSVYQEMSKYTDECPLLYFITLFSCILELSLEGKIQISSSEKGVIINEWI